MAKQMIDISLDDIEDLEIVGGDFIMRESTGQHQRQLILNNNGDFKQYPASGVGAFNYLDDENYQELTRKITTEFVRDGMDVRGIRIAGSGTIRSNAYYL